MGAGQEITASPVINRDPADAEAEYYSQHVTDRPAPRTPRVRETRDGSQSREC
jgi:hypothetical protein